MNLDLREYKTFPAEVTIDHEADNADYGVEGVAFKDVMSLKITIQRINEEYFCQGYVSIQVEQECSRCLNLFETELNGDLNFIVRTETSKMVMAADKNTDVISIKAHAPVVELNELIRQSLALSVPMKPLCSADCNGICPNCGINLNDDDCDCKKEDIDDRWEGLQGLVE